MSSTWEIVNQVREAQSLLQDEPKEKHIKTQIKHKERILKAAREKQQVT